MKSRIFNLDWDRLDLTDRVQKQNLLGALQWYCATPNLFVPPRLATSQQFVKQHANYQRALAQMFTLPSDFPVNPVEIIEKIHVIPDYDNGYEQIYEVRDYTGAKASGFDVLGVISGLTFQEYKPGEKLKVYEMRGAKYRCYFAFYGGALGWHKSLFDDGDYWTLEDNAMEFRAKGYSSRAAVYYGLIEAVGDKKGCCQVVPADCSGCDADAQAIVNSLNYAARQILTNNKDKGYGITTTTPLIVLTPLGMRGRVRQALDKRLQSFSDSAKSSDFNFVQMTSLMLVNPTRVYVILPKRTLKIGYRMDLTLLDDFDILSYTATVAGWMRHGGCIGDLDQIECIEFSDVSGSCPTSPLEPEGVPVPPEEID